MDLHFGTITPAHLRNARPRPPSRGLINAGNLSFLNATLQALLSCSPFVDLLHSLSIRDLSEAKYPFLHAFSKFFSFLEKPDTISRQIPAAICATRDPMIPIMFEPILKLTDVEGRNIWNWPREIDVEKFLSFVLNRLHQEDQELRKSDGLPEYIGGMEAFFSSRLSAIFGGQIQIGKDPTTLARSFFVLHLDIYPEGVRTLADALSRISVSGKPYGEPVVGKAGQVTGVAKMAIFPKILILHLMRFGYNGEGIKTKEVQFPLNLTLGSAVQFSREARVHKYKLVAAIYNKVVGKSERYEADCRCENDTWLHFYDANVTCKAAKDMLQGAPSVLFYEQVPE